MAPDLVALAPAVPEGFPATAGILTGDVAFVPAEVPRVPDSMLCLSDPHAMPRNAWAAHDTNIQISALLCQVERERSSRKREGA